MGQKLLCQSLNNAILLLISGEKKGTNAGGMLERVRIVMAQLTNQDSKNIKIQDLLAVNTFVPQKLKVE